MASPSADLSARASWVVLALALVAYLGLAWRQSDAFMAWDEETMVHSVAAPRVLAGRPGPDGRPRLEPSCADAHAPTFVLSSGRPRLGVCAAGRLWPLMIAPYFSGVFYWPFGLLAPLHHDNVFVLRKFTLLMGALTLALTFLLVRRLAGRRAAALAAVATAVSPCFVLTHSILVHFETLPWMWLTAAMLVLAGRSPSDAPPSSRRLTLGGFLVGLAVLANLKTVALIAPLALVAWRLDPRWRQLPLRRWITTAAAAALPLLPMVIVYLLPSGDYGDKSQGWSRSLVAHLLQPQRLVPSTRDLLLWWSNVAYYFRDFVASAPLNVAALAVAVGALAFALRDAARTLWRREGDAVTAACGASLASYVAMVALLYESFPVNYTPLHTVFGVTLAVAVDRASQAVARRASRPSLALPLALVALAPFFHNTVQTTEASRGFRLRTNPITERALVAYLRAHPAPGARIVTVDDRMAGVVDSLSDGELTTTQAGGYFRSCDPHTSNPRAQECLYERWRALLSATPGPLRVVMPLDVLTWRSGYVSLAPSLQRAARELGREVAVEREFVTAGGLPAVALHRIGGR